MNEIDLTNKISDLYRKTKKTPSDYLALARELESATVENLKSLSVSFLSTTTLEMLRSSLVVEGSLRGFKIECHFAPFNQLEQQVYPGSPFYALQPNVIVIATRLEETVPNLVYNFLKLTPHDIEKEIDAFENRLKQLLIQIRSQTNVPILLFNFIDPALLAAGLGDSLLEPSQTFVIQQVNNRLSHITRQNSDLYIFDIARIARDLGLHNLCDKKLFYLGRIPYSGPAQVEISRQLARTIRALFNPPCKCLVLDLDNTLWGGVVGEDGLEGIVLGEDYPGKVYKDFQKVLLSLKDRGVLLAIASKNNEADALEVFKKHPDCVLKLKDFSAMQINWNDKATSLRTIAEELNIGADSLAFFDDSAVEREWIRSKMPEVEVIEVPTHPLFYHEALLGSEAFDQLTISQEDRNRSQMYQGEKQRQKLQKTTHSLEDFLKELEMAATIELVNEKNLLRITQLLAKTNQFNLTTRRHSATDLQNLFKQGSIALSLRLTDRFGDNGLIGFAIATPHENWMVDTFLLSCRVMGRRAESVLLGHLSQLVREKGAPCLLGEYVPSSKNRPARDLYKLHQFESLDKEGRLWKWDFSRGTIPIPDFISVKFKNG